MDRAEVSNEEEHYDCSFSDCEPLKPTRPLEPLDLDEAFLAVSLIDLKPLNLPRSLELHKPKETFRHWCLEEFDRPYTLPWMRSHFLDLPAEMRLYIIELVLEDELRSFPPITKVCRLVREESLEYWYTNARFPIHFRSAPQSTVQSNVKALTGYNTISLVPDHAYPRLRKMLLSVDDYYTDCFLLDLDKSSNSYVIKYSTDGRTARTRGCGACGWKTRLTDNKNRLLRHFDRTMAMILENGAGGGHFTFQDYEMLNTPSFWKSSWGVSKKNGV